MRKILLLMMACCGFALAAQQVTVKAHYQLLKGVESGIYHPVLSSDGSKLLFSGSNEKGLKLYDIADNVVTTITDAERAGFEPKVTNDGKVYYVRQNAEGVIKYRTAVCYDIADKSSSVLVENERNVAPVALLSRGGALLRGSMGLKSVGSRTPDSGIAVYTEGSKVIVNNNGAVAEYSPVESYAGYLWASLSPDGSKIAFFAAGKGIVVIDLKGNVLARLGNYEMPAWLNDGYLVAQNATDDGHQFTSSQIVLLKADGSWMKELTSKTSMTMQPTTAPEAGKVAYCTIDGNLFVMEIGINE
ncbi:MAG: hypothetical protein ACI4AN_00430 [Muribaculaceae bacterium]